MKLPAWIISDIIHALVVCFTVAAACILALNRMVDPTAWTVLGAAIGYAAGKSGNKGSSGRRVSEGENGTNGN